MLSEEIIEKLCERLVDRVEQSNTYILKQIGESIKKIGNLSPAKAQQLAQILKYGGSYNKILKEIEKVTNLNIKDIEDIFEAVAKDNYEFAKQFYKYRGIDYIPYEKNIALKNQVNALARITANEYFNISNSRAIGFTVKDLFGNTTFIGLQQQYQKAIDEAVISIAQGKDTFQNQMYKTLKELGQSGIKTIDYKSGRHTRLDSAVRMNMQGALRDLSNTLQQQFGEEYGADGVEISVHENPAPDHADIQGKQFSNEEYKELNDELDRPIGELNCYHYIFSIVLGVNKPEYTQEELNKIKQRNANGFEIDGKHYTMYEGTQMQRALERKIREQKDIQILGKASGNKAIVQEAQANITKLTYKYKELSNASGLKTKMDRLRVTGYKRIDVSKM